VYHYAKVKTRQRTKYTYHDVEGENVGSHTVRASEGRTKRTKGFKRGKGISVPRAEKGPAGVSIRKSPNEQPEGQKAKIPTEMS